MDISNITIRKITSEGKMKAIVSVTFDHVFVVHDIKVIEGNNGFFIAMPSRKTQDGQFKDIVHPINSEFREFLSEAVLQKYKEALEERRIAQEQEQDQEHKQDQEQEQDQDQEHKQDQEQEAVETAPEE